MVAEDLGDGVDIDVDEEQEFNVAQVFAHCTSLAGNGTSPPIELRPLL